MLYNPLKQCGVVDSPPNLPRFIPSMHRRSSRAQYLPSDISQENCPHQPSSSMSSHTFDGGHAACLLQALAALCMPGPPASPIYAEMAATVRLEYNQKSHDLQKAVTSTGSQRGATLAGKLAGTMRMVHDAWRGSATCDLLNTSYSPPPAPLFCSLTMNDLLRVHSPPADCTAPCAHLCTPLALPRQFLHVHV